MPEPLEADLELSTSDALAEVRALGDTIESTLESSAGAFSTGMESAVASVPAVVIEADASSVAPAITDELSSIPAVELEADASSIAPEIDTAIASVDGAVLVDAETASIAPDIDLAIAAANGEVEVTAGSMAELLAAIDAAVADAEAMVRVDADTQPMEQAIAEATASLPVVEVATSFDDGGATQGLQQVGQAAEETEGDVGELTGATQTSAAVSALATGSYSTLAGNIASYEKRAGGAVGVTTGIATAIGVFVANATGAIGATQQFEGSLGNMAARVNDLRDIEGLNTTLSDLALTLGSDDDAIRQVSASLFQAASSTGVADASAAKYVQQLIALGSRAVALNPQLGTVDSAVQGISTALVRGGRTAARYGLDISAAEIKTRALEFAAQRGATEIGYVDKQMAAASLAAEKYGGSLEEDVAQGAENAIITQRRLGQTILENFETLGKPLVAPMFELMESSIPLVDAAGQVLSALATGTLPLLQTAVSLVVPPLVLLSDILTVIPTPVLGTIAALALLTKAAGSLDAGLRVLSAGTLTTVGDGLVSVSERSVGVKGRLAAAATGAVIAATGFQQVGTSATGTATGLLSMAAGGAVLGAQLGALTPLGPAGGAAIGAIAGAAVGAAKALFDSGESLDDYRKKFAELASEVKNLSDDKLGERFIDTLGKTDRAAAGLDRVTGRVVDLDREVTVLDKATGTYSTTVERMTPKVGALTNEIEAMATASPAAAEGTIRWAQSLRDAEGNAVFTEAQIRKLIAASAEGADQYDKNAVAARRAAREDEARAQAALDAALATDQAAQAGIRYVSELQRMEEASAGWGEQVASGIPTVATAFNTAVAIAEAAGREIATSFDLRDALSITADQGAQFSRDLATIADAGFVNLAASIGQQGPEVGGQIAAELANGIRDGAETPAAEMEAAIRMIVARGQVAALAMEQIFSPENWGALSDDMRAALQAAAGELDLVYVQLADGSAKLVTQGQLAFIQYVATLNDGAPKAREASRKVGEGIPAGIGEGVAGANHLAATALAALVPEDEPTAGGARGKGQRRGRKFGEGVATGMGEQSSAVHAAGVALIPEGVGADAKGTRIGHNFGQGVVGGVVSETAAVFNAARDAIPEGVGADAKGRKIGVSFGQAVASGIDSQDGHIFVTARDAIPDGVGADAKGRAIGVHFGEAIAEGIRGTRQAIRDAASSVVPGTGDGLGFDEAGNAIGQGIGDRLRAKFAAASGPGAAGARGPVAARVLPLLGPLGLSVSSSYRPGATTASGMSYHSVEGNPALDIVGSTASLDALFAILREMGGWRELLWRVPNHAPGDNQHLHVAHEGGLIQSDTVGALPGLRSDERLTVLEVGEYVVPKDVVDDMTRPVADAGALLSGIAAKAIAEGWRQAENGSWFDPQQVAEFWGGKGSTLGTAATDGMVAGIEAGSLPVVGAIADVVNRLYQEALVRIQEAAAKLNAAHDAGGSFQGAEGSALAEAKDTLDQSIADVARLQANAVDSYRAITAEINDLMRVGAPVLGPSGKSLSELIAIAGQLQRTAQSKAPVVFEDFSVKVYGVSDPQQARVAGQEVARGMLEGASQTVGAI